MNLKSKLLSIIVILVTMSYNVRAQEEDSPWSLGADLASRYIWRGINLGGSSPSVQPYIEYGFGSDDHSFAIGAWGAYSLSGTQTGQEADLYLSYTVKDVFSITLTDYFFPDETTDGYDYFNYNNDFKKIDDGDVDQTGHVLEAALSFNGTDKLPVSILFAINIWGADSRKYKDDGGALIPDDGIVMSKYIELGYSTSIKETGIDIFAGMPLDFPDTDNGEPAGFYGQTKAGLTNLGISISKEIQLTDQFSLPVYTSFITNPEAGNVFMVFGMSF